MPPLTRRQLFHLLGAGAAACGPTPLGTSLPFDARDPEALPGVPRFVATAAIEGGVATGLLAEVHEGRPTKIEGNPLHPTSLGATTARHQALVRSLYDERRGSYLREGPAPRSRRDLARLLGGGPADGSGVHLVLPRTSSLTVAAALDRLREARPGLVVHQGPALDAAELGATLALGAPLLRRPDVRAARAVLQVGGDPLVEGPLSLVHARAFGERRPRWLALESLVSPSGTRAVHRLAVPPSALAAVFAALAARLLGDRAPTLVAALRRAPEVPGAEAFLAAATASLAPGLVLVGPECPAWMHAVAHALDAVTGAPAGVAPSPLPSPTALDLEAALEAGEVHTLVLLGADAPRQARRAATLVRVAGFDDEPLADWFVPLLHDLERWGDARAADGTITPLQPTIAPLHAGLDPVEVLAMLAGAPGADVRAEVRAAVARGDEGTFAAALARGLVEGSASPVAPASPDLDAVARAVAEARWERPEGVEVAFRPSRLGEGPPDPWLCEAPDTVTQVAWGNVATLAPETAEALGLPAGSRVRVRRGEAAVALPLVLVPGQAPGVVGLELGWGRDGVGVDVGPLRRAERPWADDGVTLEVEGRAEPVLLQHADTRGERDVARFEVSREPEHRARLYGEREPRAGHQWGMAIDLAACVGCSACVIACQAENAVPVVGPEEAARGRRMHWLRIDRYYGHDRAPTVAFQPMLCQHCEDAPCEYVCPVGATVHSEDGLNQQVYNRCIGTRFCSDNCPYKVRRFNWFEYGPASGEPLALQLNPDVTTRERGVMEKCTFCVQRLREAERDARIEGRPLADGDVVPACAQACPTRAITFGDLADPEARVTALVEDERAYEELGHLGTRPRVRYLVDPREDG